MKIEPDIVLYWFNPNIDLGAMLSGELETAPPPLSRPRDVRLKQKFRSNFRMIWTVQMAGGK